jgi:hypothetical protein
MDKPSDFPAVRSMDMSSFWEDYLIRVTIYWGNHVVLAIGSILLILVIVLVVSVKNPTYLQSFVIAGVLSISFASIASEIPGLLDLNIGSSVKAAGALAVFVITLYFYFHFMPSAAPPSHSHTQQDTPASVTRHR